MTKMKKVLSLVLAFVMCVSLFANWPMPVFATEGGEPPVAWKKEPCGSESSTVAPA